MSAVVGLTLGGAYLAGSLARAAVVHAKIERLAGAASQGFSDTALEAATAHDASVLAIARRFDSPSAIPTERDDRLAAFADSLQARRYGGAQVLPGQPPAAAAAPARLASSGLLAKASFTAPAARPFSPPARPFNLRGALDESRDLECLTQAVYYEARGESAAGQAAVAQVVLNRTRHPAFPKSVCGVVYQGVRGGGCQFSFACDGSVHRRVEPYAWRRAEQVAAKALDGSVMGQVGNATHFHVASLSPGWGPRLLRVAQVGAHVFYRFGGRGGSAGAFTATPLPSEPLDPATPPIAQPVYASLAIGPLATSVANTVANSVVGAATAGAELVMAAAGPKANAATRPAADSAKPAAPFAAQPGAPAAATASAGPTPVAAVTETPKTAATAS